MRLLGGLTKSTDHPRTAKNSPSQSQSPSLETCHVQRTGTARVHSSEVCAGLLAGRELPIPILTALRWYVELYS